MLAGLLRGGAPSRAIAPAPRSDGGVRRDGGSTGVEFPVANGIFIGRVENGLCEKVRHGTGWKKLLVEDVGSVNRDWRVLMGADDGPIKRSAAPAFLAARNLLLEGGPWSSRGAGPEGGEMGVGWVSFSCRTKGSAA